MTMSGDSACVGGARPGAGDAAGMPIAMKALRSSPRSSRASPRVRRRLKILGHAEPLEVGADDGLAARLAVPGYQAVVERAIRVRIAGFDWNCPQHITPRFTLDEVERAVTPLRERVADSRSPSGSERRGRRRPMLPSETYWRFPRKSALASVRSSSTRRKPGCPPRTPRAHRSSSSTRNRGADRRQEAIGGPEQGQIVAHHAGGRLRLRRAYDRRRGTSG